MSAVALVFGLLALGMAAPISAARITILLDLDAGLPPGVDRVAVDEAAGIWRPYGVDVALRELSPPCEFAQGEATTVSVRMPGVSRGQIPGPSPFGSMRFVSGVPEPAIFLHYDAITRLVQDAGVLGIREAQWPTALRTRVMGRIVGRVLAHEIGHFVLRSTRHTSRGLMRPVQSVSELIAGNREMYELTPQDLSLLRAAMTLRAAADAEE